MSSARRRSVSVCTANVVGPFILELKFSDGKCSRVDFGPFLAKSKLPDVIKYKDAKMFARYDVVGGNVIWGDYEMLFPVAELHAGAIRIP